MVEFLYPYSFLLLLFLILFFKKNYELKVNPKLILNKSSIKFKKYLLALGYIFLVVALARPVSDKKEINSKMELKKVVLALDISKSMLADDVYPNRLGFAKHKMEQFIDKFNGEIAIMAFSDTAFLISPYTTDKDTLKYLLKNIDSNYITSSGTDFKNLVTTAKKMGYKDIVIFSDGGDIKKLNTDVNLYSLIIGNKPTPIKLPDNKFLTKDGKMVLVAINKDISKISKFSVIASSNDNDIKALISQNFSKIKSNKKLVVYNELFIYPLSLGIILLFFSFFSLPKKILPLLLLFSIQAKAGILDWYYIDKAKNSYNQGNYQKSYELYSKIDNDESRFNTADSLYKMKKYNEALKIYQTIKDKKLKEKSLYNIGNCYAKMRKIDEAIKSYEQVLKLNPNDKDAKYNLELLKKKRNKNNKNQNKQQNKKENNKNSKKHQNSKSKSKPQNKNNENKKQNKKQYKTKQELNKTKQKNQKDKIKQLSKPKNQKIQPIQLKPNKSNQVFNKIKSQTLMLPLSKGESKNEW